MKAEALTCKHCGTDFDTLTSSGRRGGAGVVSAAYAVTRGLNNADDKSDRQVCELTGNC